MTLTGAWVNRCSHLSAEATGYAGFMRFSGIDLAAEPKFTGVATLSVTDTSVRLEQVAVGVTDAQLIEAVTGSLGTGVDVPVGWPVAFAEFLQHHTDQTLEPPETTAGPWRRTLALRATDIDVHRRTGLTPLSVSANLIAYPAFRWAGIEAKLRARNVDVSRDGSGTIAEVYPAAALYRWGVPHTGYKGRQRRNVRHRMVEALSSFFETLDWNGFEDLVLADDNALDAVISALVRYQMYCGDCEGPPEHLREIARREGWIWVPKMVD